MYKNHKGFGLVEALLIFVLIGVIVGAGWYVWQSSKKTNESLDNATKASSKVSTTASSNTGYLDLKEWGVRFKIPSDLTDVRYVIHDDTVAIYAKPTNSSVEYRGDYDKFEDGFPKYASGVLYRSADSTKSIAGVETRPGKKVGNNYYYTAWAFSSLASGAACTGLYGDGVSSESNCQPESAAFQLVNQGNNALLNTIELTQ